MSQTYFGISLPYTNPFTGQVETCYAYAGDIHLVPIDGIGAITFFVFASKAAADAGHQPLGTIPISLVASADGSGRPVYSDQVAANPTIYAGLASVIQALACASIPSAVPYSE